MAQFSEVDCFLVFLLHMAAAGVDRKLAQELAGQKDRLISIFKSWGLDVNGAVRPAAVHLVAAAPCRDPQLLPS